MLYICFGSTPKPMTTQDVLFQNVKEKLPANISFVHDLSELLEISYDSSYRRIRGEKDLTLEEFRKICVHYNVSADILFNLHSGNMIFNTRAIGFDGLTYEKWIETILTDIKTIQECHEKEIIYAAKDIPLFHYFEFPEIAAFKAYFWHKALFPAPEQSDRPFTFQVPEEMLSAGKRLTSIYRTIPTTEIWNEETITSILRQIDYCFVSGFFTDKRDAIRLTEGIESWIKHVQHQVELGFRFHYGSEPEGIPDSFRFYFNDVLLSDNTIFVKMDGRMVTYMTYNIINLLVSNNPLFCKQIESSLSVIMQKSTLISGTSAKERNRFFCRLLEKVKNTREQIERA
jgi:hypothetical protein